MSFDTFQKIRDISKYVNMMRSMNSEPCCAPLLSEPLASADAVTMAADFKVLADPVRLQLLSLIASTPEGEMCACDLTEPVGRSQPTVSHHLSILTEAGFLEREQRGRWAWFRVVPDRLAVLREALVVDRT